MTALAAVDPGTTGQVFTVGDAGIRCSARLPQEAPSRGQHLRRALRPLPSATRYTVTSARADGQLYRCDVAGRGCSRRAPADLDGDGRGTARLRRGEHPRRGRAVARGVAQAAARDADSRRTSQPRPRRSPQTACARGRSAVRAVPRVGTTSCSVRRRSAGPSRAAAPHARHGPRCPPGSPREPRAERRAGGASRAATLPGPSVRASAANVTGLSLCGTDPVGTGAYPSSRDADRAVRRVHGHAVRSVQTPVDAASRHLRRPHDARHQHHRGRDARRHLCGVARLVLGAHSYSRNVEFYRGRLRRVGLTARSMRRRAGAPGRARDEVRVVMRASSRARCGPPSFS